MICFSGEVCTLFIYYHSWQKDRERKPILKGLEEMANEIIIEMMQLIPVITFALITLTFYFMYHCQERFKGKFITIQYTKQIHHSTMIGQDGLIRPSVTYKINGLNPEVNNDFSTISLNVPILSPVLPAYKPTEMITKVWQDNSDLVHLYHYSTFVMVDETHMPMKYNT